MAQVFFTRAGRAGRSDLAQRVPELAPMQSSTICVFGLGALGAPSALEFARCGAKVLRVIDYDYVDPATACRWPFGLQAAGLHKAQVIQNAIARDYPYTRVTGIPFYIGGIRNPDAAEESTEHVMHLATEGATLIYDATAEIGVQQYLSDYALSLGIPYVGIDATPGAWGGRIVRILPGRDMPCWMCYQLARESVVPEPSARPSDEIQPAGCADVTFTGANFDLMQIAMCGVRTAVSTLCAQTPGGYPVIEWDVLTISFRNSEGGVISPHFSSYKLSRHSECLRCNSQA